MTCPASAPSAEPEPGTRPRLVQLLQLRPGDDSGHCDVMACQQLPCLGIEINASLGAGGQDIPEGGPHHGQHQQWSPGRVPRSFRSPAATCSPVVGGHADDGSSRTGELAVASVLAELTATALKGALGGTTVLASLGAIRGLAVDLDRGELALIAAARSVVRGFEVNCSPLAPVVPHDLMVNAIAAAAAASSSSPSPWWVTVVAASVGAGAAIIVGIITALATGHRENVRWKRERTERDRQWQRERDERRGQWEREDSLRWVQTRQEAYARLVANLRDWDSELLSALTVLKLNKQYGDNREIDKTRTEQAQSAARDTLTLAEFLAPDSVADQAGTAFRNLQLLHAGIRGYPTLPPGGVDELQKLWERATHAQATLKRSLRDDLGLAGVPVTPQPGSPPASSEAQGAQS